MKRWSHANTGTTEIQKMMYRPVKTKRKGCILHIGMHTTGASSLQKNLADNDNNINFVYIDLGTADHSMPLYALFGNKQKTNKYVTELKYATERLISIQKRIDQLFRQAVQRNEQSKTFVLSGEGVTMLDQPELLQLKRYLTQFFEKIEVFAYVRSPIAYMNSMAQERVKDGSIDFENLDILYPHYRHSLSKFDHVFGKKNVQLCPFDKEGLYDGNITNDFLERHHLKVKRTQFRFTDTALSLEAISFLYLFYKYGPGYGMGANKKRQNDALVEYMISFGTRSVKISMYAFNILFELYKEDIHWIETRLDTPLLDEAATIFDQVDEIRCEKDLIVVAKENMEQFKVHVSNMISVDDVVGATLDDLIVLMQRLRRAINHDMIHRTEKKIQHPFKQKNNRLVC